MYLPFSNAYGYYFVLIHVSYIRVSSTHVYFSRNNPAQSITEKTISRASTFSPSTITYRHYYQSSLSLSSLPRPRFSVKLLFSPFLTKDLFSSFRLLWGGGNWREPRRSTLREPLWCTIPFRLLLLYPQAKKDVEQKGKEGWRGRRDGMEKKKSIFRRFLYWHR